MFKNNFKKLLQLGQAAEEQAIKKVEVLHKTSCTKRQNETNFKIMHHDFQTEDNIKYEVKLDISSTKTGNAFVEFLDGKGHDSGLNISDANYYIIISNDIYYMIGLEALKELIKGCKIAQARDGTKGYLLKIDTLKGHSIKI